MAITRPPSPDATPAPVSAQPPPAAPPDPVHVLPEVKVTGSREVTFDDILEAGPEVIENMTPQQLQQMRDTVHQLGIGAGSAATLGAITEGLRDAREEMAKQDPNTVLVDQKTAKEQGIDMDKDVTLGQSANLMSLTEQLMCRTARHQIENENYVDRETLKHGDPGDQARAARDLEANRKLSERLDPICKAPAPAP